MTSNWLYEVSCAGLNAALQLLEEAGHPAPVEAQVLAHPPVLDCGCDALFVTPGPSQSVSLAAGEFNPFTGLPSVCDITGYSAEFEVHLTRCVTITDPKDQDCWNTGSCSDVLAAVCDGEPPAWPEGGLCRDRAPDKATEGFWLMAERFLLEQRLASTWRCALVEGWCRPDRAEACSAKVSWVRTEVHDEGGCGGSILTFTASTF